VAKPEDRKNTKNLREAVWSTNIEPRKVFISNYQFSYSDNQKYIAEKLHETLPDTDVVFAVHENYLKDVPKCFRAVKANSLEHYQEMLSAKIWIDNAFSCVRPVPKKRSQVLIETWHASSGFKLIGKRDALVEISRAEIDYVLSSSLIDSNRFSKVWPEAKILDTGHPRNDILFRDSAQYRRKVREYYGFDESVKLLLYAPTYRQDQTTDTVLFMHDFTTLHEKVSAKFEGDWIILLRLHHKDKNAELELEGNVSVVDVTAYPDMQELIAACDIGISDYSSWMPCMLMIRKPVFSYALDFKTYGKTRGFMHSVDKTPIPIATSDQALWDIIDGFDNDEYLASVDKYLKEYKFIDDGHATERVVSLIEKILDGEMNALSGKDND
jgi:CDP-glycerol glycerophosphotransferase